MNSFPNLTKVISKDELRPALMYAYFKGGYLYATNAHIAVKLPTNLITDNEEEINTLNGKAFDIDALTLLSKSYRSMRVAEEGIVCYPTKGKSKFVRWSASLLDEEKMFYIANDEEVIDKSCSTFPTINIDAVIPTNISIPSADYLSLNLDFLQTLKGAFIGKADSVILAPTEKNKAVRVVPVYNGEPCYKQVAICMPLQLHIGTEFFYSNL